MSIDQYLDRLEGSSKRHILLIVAPKGKYPINFLDEDYHSFERSILQNPKEYISLYGDDPNEIMQYVAFREYIRPLICDKYSLVYNTKEKVRRATKEEITSFIVAKSFFDSVPSGLKTEEESIEDGLTQAYDFLNKFSLERFEHTLVKLGKDSDEANVVINISLKNNTDEYYFERVHIR
ncbi:hypothetical protein J25TS5_54820 [Paenibacillus faecis]|uniref:hypothetical protein n=1 Tax=Paenibacillus faecis TaxID=862114 RepID=UPI001AFD7766|nr:hypothetical protein [Paenibacillus faecis]GIO88550.1 hypothetical protein J25TS5_54820 [Paenibacillus faecis]